MCSGAFILGLVGCTTFAKHVNQSNRMTNRILHVTTCVAYMYYMVISDNLQGVFTRADAPPPYKFVNIVSK